MKMIIDLFDWNFRKSDNWLYYKSKDELLKYYLLSEIQDRFKIYSDVYQDDINFNLNRITDYKKLVIEIKQLVKYYNNNTEECAKIAILKKEKKENSVKLLRKYNALYKEIGRFLCESLIDAAETGLEKHILRLEMWHEFIKTHSIVEEDGLNYPKINV